MKSFVYYGGKDGAKQFVDGLVNELAKHSQAAMQTPRQATDTLAALEWLDLNYQTTGKRVSMLSAVSEFCDVSTLLGMHTLREVGEGFHRTVASQLQHRASRRLRLRRT